MDRSGFVSTSGRPAASTGTFCVYTDEEQKTLPAKTGSGKGLKGRAEDKENISPQLQQQELSANSSGGGVYPGKPGPPAPGQNAAPQRKPLRDVTHLFYPGARKNAGNKNAGLRSMR